MLHTIHAVLPDLNETKLNFSAVEALKILFPWCEVAAA
jgi:hypothetical protein